MPIEAIMRDGSGVAQQINGGEGREDAGELKADRASVTNDGAAIELRLGRRRRRGVERGGQRP